MKAPAATILSRTDSIGDVMLTLPMAGWIKRRHPHTRVVFIGRTYTLPVLRCCAHVDAVITMEELRASRDPVQMLRSLGASELVHVFPQREVARWAKEADIPVRIGTAHRWWHWTTCNVRPWFSRRKSDLHEAQLNFKLLEPSGEMVVPSLAELITDTGFVAPAPDAPVEALLPPGKHVVILHPGSRGSAVEWGIRNHVELARSLDPDRHVVYFTGTEAEGAGFRSELPKDLVHVQDLSGRLSLEQLIALIARSHALVAASTGPLHIAAACGIRAIGLYAPRRPIHPGRWAPLGLEAHALVYDPACTRCAKGAACDCITRIAPTRVRALIEA
ncbi:MAG TPA: glycosyltransferase family 9 protein [Flavobacteriales bacterium]